MTPQISQLDKCCGGKLYISCGHHILLRSTIVPPSTEPDVAASDIVQVFKEYLNEMPYWKYKWEPPTVNKELEECIYKELAAKNWDLSPQYLRATVNIMATFTEVNCYFLPTAFVC